MDTAPIKILLVEDNAGDARLLREVLRDAGTAPFELDHVERLQDALRALREAHFDVVLLDLSLPDAQGLDTLTQTHENAPDMPIIVLTGNDDETLGLQAVKTGAQDYLIKG